MDLFIQVYDFIIATATAFLNEWVQYIWLTNQNNSQPEKTIKIPNWKHNITKIREITLINPE